MKQHAGTWRYPIALVVSLSMGLGVGACKSGNAAQRLASSTAPTLEGSTGKCKPGNAASKSLVVEWPMSERAALEGRVQRGLVAVRYRNCEMELITNCSVIGNYEYLSVTPKSENVKITNADELYAKIPIGAVRLEGQLARSGQLNVDMILVGRHEADRFRFAAADLSGRCEGATHVVTGLNVGAFVFYAGAGADIGLSGSAAGTGISAGANSTASKEMLNRDGDMAACIPSDGVSGPPPGCSALLGVEVVPIDFPEPTNNGSTAVSNLTDTKEVAGVNLTTSDLDRRIKIMNFTALSGYLVAVSGILVFVFGYRMNAAYKGDIPSSEIGQPGSSERAKFVSRYNASLGMIYGGIGGAVLGISLGLFATVRGNKLRNERKTRLANFQLTPLPEGGVFTGLGFRF